MLPAGAGGGVRQPLTRRIGGALQLSRSNKTHRDTEAPLSVDSGALLRWSVS
jgi:hypothetical protein